MADSLHIFPTNPLNNKGLGKFEYLKTYHSIFKEMCHHQYNLTLLFPYHSPKVVHSILHGCLACYVETFVFIWTLQKQYKLVTDKSQKIVRKKSQCFITTISGCNQETQIGKVNNFHGVATNSEIIANAYSSVSNSSFHNFLLFTSIQIVCAFRSNDDTYKNSFDISLKKIFAASIVLYDSYKNCFITTIWVRKKLCRITTSEIIGIIFTTNSREKIKLINYLGSITHGFREKLTINFNFC